MRGIISPPRSQYSPRQCRPNELHQSHRKQTQPVAIPSITKNNKGHKKLHNDYSNCTTKVKPISQPTTPRIDSRCSRTKLSSGAAERTGIAKDKCELSDWLQLVSIHGNDLANIILHRSSIYESIGSKRKEGQRSSKSNDSRMLQIYKKIASHRQQNSSITSYFKKLKALWNELDTFNTNLPQCSYDGAIEKLREHIEKEKVIQFLVGLNDSYSTICNQILRTMPFPTVEEAYYAIMQEEKLRGLDVVVALPNVMKKMYD